MMKCTKCGRDFDEGGEDCRVASISGSIMGDEYIDSYYFCSRCGFYTVEVYHDRFLGEDEASLRGPIPKSDGDERVALIHKCSEPWNKKCRCKAHRAYFGDWLD